jgi:hypothetical protein
MREIERVPRITFVKVYIDDLVLLDDRVIGRGRSMLLAAERHVCGSEIVTEVVAVVHSKLVIDGVKGVTVSTSVLHVPHSGHGLRVIKCRPQRLWHVGRQ